MSETVRIEHENISVNGITLHVALAGPKDGRPIVMLHGFPECWEGWRKQLGFLAQKGFRAIAPDQRGYNLSDKPKEIGAYSIEYLTADVVGLLDALRLERAALAGHDWGAAVAWHAAGAHPERFEKLIIVNVPHLAVMRRHLFSSPKQILKSHYMFFFQLPGIPEATLSKNNCEALVKTFVDSSRPGTFEDGDFDKYREAWRQPGALTGGINWYRAAFRTMWKAAPRTRIKVPTLMIWGARDKFLGAEMAQPSVDLCEDGRLVMIDDATHWVHHEEPDRVNGLMAEFLGE